MTSSVFLPALKVCWPYSDDSFVLMEKHAMCVACGQELCKQCKGCHNSECERYIKPTEECETDGKNSQSASQGVGNATRSPDVLCSMSIHFECSVTRNGIP